MTFREQAAIEAMAALVRMTAPSGAPSEVAAAMAGAAWLLADAMEAERVKRERPPAGVETRQRARNAIGSAFARGAIAICAGFDMEAIMDEIASQTADGPVDAAVEVDQ